MIEKRDTIYDHEGCGQMITFLSYGKSDVKFISWHPYKHEVNLRILNSETLVRGILSEKSIYTFGNFNASSGYDSILYKGMSYIKPYAIRHERNGQFVSEEKTVFSLYTVNGVNKLLPKLVISTNSYNIIDTLVIYSQYTNTGMPIIFKEKGQPTIFLKWGGNDCFLSMVGNAYIPISISLTQFYDQEKCLAYMTSFIKGYTSGQITGYVWDPLFGPTAIVRPNGNVNTYKYDRFGRLVYMYDYNNILLKEYQYNYRK